MKKWSSLALIVLIVIGGTGCGKIKAQKKARENARKQAELEKKRENVIATVRPEALQLLAKAKEKIPPFDRKSERKKMVKKLLKLDLNRMTLKSKKEVKETVQQRAKAIVDQVYPPATRKKMLKELQQEYKVFKVGDPISITLVNGRSFDGKISYLDGKVIKVGPYQLLVRDIRDPDPVRFNPEKAAKKISYLMRLNFDIAYRDRLAAEEKKMYPKVLQEFGYFRRNGHWVRYDAIIKKTIEPQLDKMEKNYLAAQEADLQKKVMQTLRKKGALPKDMDIQADEIFSSVPQDNDADIPDDL